jgi:hypothetical protein
MFGELAIAHHLKTDGWSAVWADTFHGQKFWNGMPHQISPVSIPTDVRQLYDRIAALKGSASGCFDVIAWKDGRTIFLEYKGPGDKPNKNELSWIDAALKAGVAEEDLFFVGDSARATVRAKPVQMAGAQTGDRSGAAVARQAQPVRSEDVPRPAPQLEVEEFTSDSEYFRWLSVHPQGFVLNVQGKKIVLHRASCTHIDRHNNAGALTERGAQKFGAEERAVLTRWAQQRGLASGPLLPKCRSCF